MADDRTNIIKKLKNPIKIMQFNLQKLKNNEKPFNMNKY